MKDKANSTHLGTVVSVRGSVVDIRFDEYLPPIYSLLHAQEGKIAIEVLAQLDAYRVRGIALTPTQGLARGMAVEDTGGPLKAPVGKGILSRMFDVFGNAIDGQAAPRKKGLHVTFQKEKTDSYGRPHKVPLKTVYITGKTSKEEAVDAAVKCFEAERKTPWDKAADSIDVQDGPDSEPDKPAR